ncbi:MAG: MFS transporter [Alphaproteobacteria bacterium]|nr:MFS transporter [Alphaproteobacteria bacterium]
MTEATDRGAIAPLLATSSVQIMASLTMFGVAVIAPVAAPDIGVEATLIGTFTAIAYGSGMLAGLLTGAFSDRFGAIRVAQTMMVLAMLGVACLALSNPLAALISAIVLGISYGPINPLSTHILARVVPEPRRPLFFSIKQSAQPAGTALAGAVLPLLVILFDWRVAILATGVAACIVAIAIQSLRPRLDGGRDLGRTIRVGSVMEPLRLVWRDSRLRCLALSGFIFSGTQVSLASFFVVYLTDALSRSLTTAGLIFTVMQIGGVLGRLFWGAIADSVIPANYVLPGLGAATAVFSIVTGYFAPDWPVLLLGVLSFALGATSHGWNGVYFSELVKFAPPGTVGDAASGAQFATLAGVAVVPVLFGLIVTLSGSYLAAFYAVAGAIAVATTYMRLTLRSRG